MTLPRPLSSVSFSLTTALSSLALLTAGALALPATATAQDDEADYVSSEDVIERNYYVDYLVGVAHTPDDDIETSGLPVDLSGDYEGAPVGYFVGGAFGVHVFPNIRGEIQIGYRRSELDALQLQNEPDGAGNSTLSLFSVVYNAYYDVDLAAMGIEDSPVQPWVGAGIGWGMPRIDAQNVPGANQVNVDDTDSTMVYNVMAGGTWPITPQAAVVFGYRYIRTLEVDAAGTVGGVPTVFDYTYSAHEGFTGLRFSF